MKRGFIWLCPRILLTCFVQLFLANAAPESKIMLAAISRDGALVVGGLGSGNRLKPGSAYVEPLHIFQLRENGKGCPVGLTEMERIQKAVKNLAKNI